LLAKRNPKTGTVEPGEIKFTSGDAGHIYLAEAKNVVAAGQFILVKNDDGKPIAAYVSNGSGSYTPDISSVELVKEKLAELGVPEDAFIMARGMPVNTQAFKIFLKAKGVDKKEIKERVRKLDALGDRVAKELTNNLDGLSGAVREVHEGNPHAETWFRFYKRKLRANKEAMDKKRTTVDPQYADEQPAKEKEVVAKKEVRKPRKKTVKKPTVRKKPVKKETVAKSKTPSKSVAKGKAKPKKKVAKTTKTGRKTPVRRARPSSRKGS